MKRKNRRLYAFVLMFILLAVMAVAVNASEIGTTVNLTNPGKHVYGDGYTWNNVEDTLTLNGLNINTDEDYGLRLPRGATIILEGKNTVKAAKYGISCQGTVVFKGNGSLTVDAGEIGIYIITQEQTQKIRFVDGQIKVSAGKYGVFSEAADFSFAGKSLDISLKDGGEKAVSGRSINLIGGTFRANSSVYATHELVVDGIDLDITSSEPALEAKLLTVDNIKISGGGEYGGENEIKAKADVKSHRTSLVFGENVPGWIDYIIAVVLLSAVAACIVGPIMHRRKKAKELYERLEREGYDIVK